MSKFNTPQTEKIFTKNNIQGEHLYRVNNQLRFCIKFDYQGKKKWIYRLRKLGTLNVLWMDEQLDKELDGQMDGPCRHTNRPVFCSSGADKNQSKR